MAKKNVKTEKVETKPAVEPQAQAPEAAQQEQRFDPAPIIGMVAGLMMDSPMHQHLFLADMKWLVIPAVALQQYRIFRKDGIPVAYVSWAMISEETEARLMEGKMRLRPDEWKGGDRVWIIDLIAPFGGQQAIMMDLKDKVFGGNIVKAMQPDKDGRGYIVVEI